MISLLNDSLDESQVHDSVLRSENQRDKPQLSNFLCRSVCGDVCLAASVFESFCVSPVSVYLGISVSSLIDGILRNVTPFSKLHSWVLPRMLVLSANLCKAGKAGTVTQYEKLL